MIQIKSRDSDKEIEAMKNVECSDKCTVCS